VYRSQCAQRRAVPYAAIVGVTALLLWFSSSPRAQETRQPKQRTLIRAGHVLHVKTGKETPAQTIIVSGDRITSIAATASTPAQAGDKEIDLSKFYVMPGLIDVHAHLTLQPGGNPYALKSPAQAALIGAEHARMKLDEGTTTVRNVGAWDFSDVALRDEVDAGRLPGPHMQVSGPPLSITGGHCDINLFPSEYHLERPGVADGVAAVQHKVRENIKYGVDLIKVCATGGVSSKGDDPQASQYTQEELQVIIVEAHRLGRKVAAHAHGAQGILWATEAGADSIEHGSYISDAEIAAMKAHGTYLVPTAYVYNWVQQHGGLPDYAGKKMQQVAVGAKANLRRAISAGVKVALGTDLNRPNAAAHEVEVYVNELGMTPLAALQAGTISAADLMGWADRVGSLDPGKWADIIAVATDPLKDVRVLQQILFVMKGGIVYKSIGHHD